MSTAGPVERRDDGHCTYAFWRRAYVGKHVANGFLFISISTVLWSVSLNARAVRMGRRSCSIKRPTMSHRSRTPISPSFPVWNF